MKASRIDLELRTATLTNYNYYLWPVEFRDLVNDMTYSPSLDVEEIWRTLDSSIRTGIITEVEQHD